ncbi:restriction endonuclease subunit S [Salmonella enterica subsp. enterica]|nr:restriction endonuclease subunit S [Salmonella enterica subsp. enterica]
MSFELFEYKIEDLGKIITGKTPPSKISDAFSAQGIPFVTPKDMDGRRLIDKTERYLSSLGIEAVRNCLLPQNSIAVSCIGSDMGKTVLLPCESITNQQINAIVVDSERFDYKYVYYYLSTLQDAFKAIAGGSATPILNKGHFSQFKVSLPVKLVQNKIALILDSLDTKIEVNTEINQTLEQMAQALFKSWFVDFEPVKNKIAVLEAGGSQEEATLAAMTAISGKDADALAVFEREHPEQYAQLKATAELFPAAMQDSELGAIPKGWGVASISEMGKVTCGKTPSKKEPEYYGSDVPFIKIPDMHGQLFVLKTNEYLSEAGSKSQLKKLVPANSICVSCIATIGVVSITNEPSHTNQQINSVTPHKSSLLYYLYFCMLGLKDHLHILGSAGSATLNVNTSTFSGIKIAQPDAKVLELFHAKCTHLFNEIKSLSVQTESLTQLRDTLLPKLLSGEITLPEAEQIISEEA